MKKYIIILFVFLSGCSASGPLFKSEINSNNDQSLVYVYRPSMGFNYAGWPIIYVNSEEKFSLRNNGYGILTLNEGTYTIKAEGSILTNWWPSPASIEFEVKKGKEYYIRVTPKPTGIAMIGSVTTMSGRSNMSILPKEIALPEISETKKVN